MLQAPEIPASSVSKPFPAADVSWTLKGKQHAYSHSHKAHTGQPWHLQKRIYQHQQKTENGSLLVWSLMKEAFWVLILMLKGCPQRPEQWSLLTGDRWRPPWFGLWALPTSGPLRQNLAETSSPRGVCSCFPHKLSVSWYLNTEQNSLSVDTMGALMRRHLPSHLWQWAYGLSSFSMLVSHSWAGNCTWKEGVRKTSSSTEAQLLEDIIVIVPTWLKLIPLRSW